MLARQQSIRKKRKKRKGKGNKSERDIDCQTNDRE
jgi:hypothetical protein